MTDRPRSTPTKVCPSCGTRVSENANRCLVCGHQFDTAAAPKRKVADSSRTPTGSPATTRTPTASGGLPQLNLSLPVAIGLLVLFLLVGGGITYFGLVQTDRVAVPTGIPSATPSPSTTPTPTPATPTATSTPQATYTPLAYTVVQNDTCGSIAAVFNIGVQSLLLANNLGADCNLFVGQVLSVPQPTFTPTPLATSTLSNEEATLQACETVEHVVQENDTLSIIAQSYGVPLEAIQEWNGLTSDTAFLGQLLLIPLCERVFVAGATVTPTLAPPYPAPELLLPANGEAFDISSDTVTLQWSSVGTLRSNELYQVTVIDLTSGQNRMLVEEVVSTNFIIPASFRVNESRPHIYRWYVVPVAQIGVDDQGLPVFVEGGPVSESRYFSWSGSSSGGAPAATVTPQP